MSLVVDDLLIKTAVPLAGKNWFGTGGAAQFFAEPQTVESLQEALHYAQKHSLPIILLGNGANVVIADQGVAGLVLRLAINHIKADVVSDTEVLVTVGAGFDMADLIEWCFDHNIIGLHEFSGIPSSVGGAMFINLHFFSFLISQFVVSARVIDFEGNVENVDVSWFLFSYNYSRLHEKKQILLDVTFKLTRVDGQRVSFERGRSHEIKRYRKYRYPSKNTCGSFFRNFFPEEVTLEHQGKKVVWAAYYLDQAGVKGAVSVGSAAVSTQHANMIVVDAINNPKTSDIIECARICQERVWNLFGLMLRPECQLIGFTDNPLLTI